MTISNKTKRISVTMEDISNMAEKVDAVVNAANSNLTDGGGVNGAIHKAAGLLLNLECLVIRCIKGKISDGNVIVTKAYRMSCRYLFHAIGPIWTGGINNERQILEMCYINALKMAEKKNCHSIAFPIISAGIYGYPKKEAIEIAILTVSMYLERDCNIDKVFFVVRDEDMYRLVLDFILKEEFKGDSL